MLAAAVETLVWWGLLVGVWVLTLSGTTKAELAVAAAAGLASALPATAVRRAVGGCWRPRLRWLGWPLMLPPSIVADTWRVFVLAAKHVRHRHAGGNLIYLPLHVTGERETHRALATLTLSVTPGTLVVDSDSRGHGLTMHVIASGRPDLQRLVQR